MLKIKTSTYLKKSLIEGLVTTLVRNTRTFILVFVNLSQIIWEKDQNHLNMKKSKAFGLNSSTRINLQKTQNAYQLCSRLEPLKSTWCSVNSDSLKKDLKSRNKKTKTLMKSNHIMLICKLNFTMNMRILQQLTSSQTNSSLQDSEMETLTLGNSINSSWDTTMF